MSCKKIIIMVALLFILCFTACGSQTEGPAPSGDGINIEVTPSDGDEPTNSEKTRGNQGYDFIGLWHESPMVASGFSERLLLDSDNTFIWTASQMDGFERVRARCGYWSLAGEKLELETTEEIRWIGGKLVPAYASWGTDEVVEGAEVVLIEPVKPILAAYDFSAVTSDSEALNKKTITIGGIQYWELSGTIDRDDLLSDYNDLKAQATTATPVNSQDLPEVPGIWAVEYISSGAESSFRIHVTIPISSHDIKGAYYGSGTAVLGIQCDEGNGKWRDCYYFDLWDWDGPVVMSAIFMEWPAGDIYPYSSFRARMTHSYYDNDGNLRLSDSDWSEVVIAEDETEFP